jgi:hypothetical protein
MTFDFNTADIRRMNFSRNAHDMLKQLSPGRRETPPVVSPRGGVILPPRLTIAPGLHCGSPRSIPLLASPKSALHSSPHDTHGTHPSVLTESLSLFLYGVKLRCQERRKYYASVRPHWPPIMKSYLHPVRPRLTQIANSRSMWRSYSNNWGSRRSRY